MKMELNGSWLSDVVYLDMEYPKRVEILIDKFKKTFVPDNEVRIVVIWEPTGYLVSDVQRYPDFYTHVFTYHPFILNNNEKAVFFLGVTCFARPAITHTKRFSVSSVIGDKRKITFPGYKMRHELWFKRNHITIPEEFRVSGNTRFKGQIIHTDYGDIDVTKHPTVGEYKDDLFESMFHIAIENVFEDSWFTEKVVDCFLKRTIPIYIGAKNIGEHFNADGILQVSTVDEAIAVCNVLTERDYYDRIDAMEDNYQRSLKYLDYNKMIGEKIKEILP